MPNVHPEFGRMMSAEEYAREWEGNSSQFQRLGYYKMPLERLGKPRTVLEIGSGSGRSTLALAKKRHTVVAVEINEPAACAALEYLRENGINAELTHDFPTEPVDPSTGPQVTIVVGDIHAPGVLNAIPAASFDAVLCWFIGAQLDVIADFAGKPNMQLASEDVRNYRLAMQAKCYAVGRHVLRDKGIVQVADRMRIQSWQDKDFARDEQAGAQARIAGPGYQISRASTFLARIDGVFEGSAIQYLADQPGAQVRVVTSVIGTLVSR